MNEQAPNSEELLVRELRGVGIEVQSIYDLVNTSKPYSRAYPILVRHLRLSHDTRTREGIIRALTVKEAGPAARLLYWKSSKQRRMRS